MKSFASHVAFEIPLGANGRRACGELADFAPSCRLPAWSLLCNRCLKPLFGCRARRKELPPFNLASNPIPLLVLGVLEMYI